MPSRELRTISWSAGAFVLPILAIKAAAIMLGSATPESAVANSEAAQPAATEPASKPAAFTASQQAASKRIVELQELKFGASPLYYEPQTESASAPTPAQPAVAPQFVLGAIMSTSRGSKAVINGRPYAQGDAIGDSGWTLQSINSANRSVVLLDPATGHMQTITVALPMN